MGVGSFERSGLYEAHIAALLQDDRALGELLRRRRRAPKFATAGNIDGATYVALIALVQAKCRDTRVRRNLAHLRCDKFSVGIVHVAKAKLLPRVAKHFLELIKREFIGMGDEFKDFGNDTFGLIF